MPRRSDINKVIINGSGPIVIGQGCESTTPEPRPAKRFEGWVTRYSW
jgi:hypothetical protein